MVYEVRVERFQSYRRWLRGRLEEQPIQTEGQLDNLCGRFVQRGERCISGVQKIYASA